MPGAGSDVIINSGVNTDNVTLDVGTTTINSLQIGGAFVGYATELQDAGTTQILNITNGLTLGNTQSYLSFSGTGSQVNVGGNVSNSGQISLNGGATLNVTGNFDNMYYANTGGGSAINVTGTLTNNLNFYEQGGGSASIGNLVNNGYFLVGGGSSVNLTNQPNGITDVVSGSRFDVAGTFTAGANSAFYKLTSVEGSLYLENGQTTNITPGGGLFTNSGLFQISNSSTVNITGDVTNNNNLYTEQASTINISGHLTNNTYFQLLSSGDMANVGTLTNNYEVNLNTGATLNLTNQPNGLTDVASGTYFLDYGTFTAGANNGFYKLNSVEGQLYLGNGQVLNDTPGSGTFTNTGYVQVSAGSTWNINGNVLNSAGTMQTDGGTINISGGLTNNSNFYMYNSGDTASAATLVNNGYVYLAGGTTLNLTNQPGGITDVVAGSRFDLLGNFNVNGGSNNGFNSLTSVEGLLIIANGQTANITPNGGTLTIAYPGQFSVSGGSTVNITGDVNNSYNLLTSYYYGGSNDTLNISGTLTNNSGSQLYMNGSGDLVNVASLNNNGYVYIGPGSTLNLQNQSGGITDVVAGSRFDVWGNFNDVAGGGYGFNNLNSVEGVVILYGQNATITPGSGTLTISSTGNLSANYSPYVPGGTTLTINGNVDNSGFLSTDYYYGFGGNTLTITGNLTNHAGGDFWMYSYYGGADVANVGTLTNNGSVLVGPYATLNLTNQPSGITDAVAGSRFDLYGTFNAGGNPGFGQLNSVEGQITLYGQNFTITPGSGTLTIASTGNFTANYNGYSALGTNLTIAGNVDNSGFLATSYNSAGSPGNTLNITGNLTNHAGADFWVYNYYISGTPDVANVASLNNAGYTFVGTFATLNLTNQLGGITDVVAGSRFAIEGAFNDVMGGKSALAGLTNVEGMVDLYGQSFNITPSGGTLTIAGGGNFTGNYAAYSGLGTTTTVNGNVDNSGFLGTGYYAQSGGAVGADTLTITGNLTNHPGGQLYMNGYADVVNVNGDLNNANLVQLAYYNQTLNVGGSLNNAGTMYLFYSGDTVNVGGNLDNSGTVYDGYYGQGNDTLTVTGNLTNETSGTISVNGSNTLLAVGGTATNKGLISVLNGSTFDPPTLNNFGVINVDGMSKLVVGSGGVPGQGYTQFANGTLGEMIGAANYGVINITGNVTLALGSTLDILLQGGYNPTPGSTYAFLNFTGSLTGTFTNILNQTFNNGTEGWNLIYGGSFIELQAYCVTTCAIADNWLGGTDVWSNGNEWSVGVPGSGNDVFIYSGGNDNVTYNMGSSTINSLTLGGASNGFSSTLTDGGTNQSLTILAQLVVGQTGVLQFSGSGSSITAGANSSNQGQIYLSNGAKLSITGDFDNSYYAEANGGGSAINVTGTLTNGAGATFYENGGSGTASIGSLVNNGEFYVGSGATVNLTNQAGGIQDVVAGSRFDILGNFNEGGGLNNAFEQLTSIEGDLFLANGGNFGITPNGGTLTISGTGSFDVSAGTTISVLGGVSNSGYFTTSAIYGGGNATINVTGTVNNAAQFYLYGGGDFANVGALNNTGYTYVGAGATLHLTGQPGGIQDVVAGSRFDILGSFNEGAGTNNGFEQLTSIEGLAVLANGAANAITPNGGLLTISSAGTLDVALGATAQINGSVNNNGHLTTGSIYGGGNSTINITGNLNNAGNFYLYDVGDTANVATLNNTGYTYIGPGATLNLTNQPGGITDAVAGSRFDLLGTFNAGGNFGFGGLSSVEGLAIIANGAMNTITPGGGTFSISNTGTFAVSNGTAITIEGDVTNNGQLYTGNYYGGSASTLTITGNLNNNSAFDMYQVGDSVNVGGNTDNTGQMAWNNSNQSLVVAGNLTNENSATISVNYGGSSLHVGGTLTNLGTMNASFGAVIDPPTLINGGTINVDGTSKLVVGSGGVPGQGYTQFHNGTLGEIITAAGFGVINVTGAANLDGTLNIMLANGYDPANGTEFKFLNFTPNMLNGTFANVLNTVFNNGTQQFMVGYNSALGFVELVAEPFNGGNTDYWLGGTENWSNNGMWSLGHYPTPTNDAVIYSDIANDLVTLDLGSTSVNSLQIGGNDLTYYSELTDGGTTQTLDIAGALTIGDSGRLVLTGGSTITAGADSSNAGQLGLFNGSMLSIAGNFNNASSGVVDLENGSQLQVTGNVNNSGFLETAFYHNGGNTLNIGGTLTNNPGAHFYLFGTKDVANVGMVDNLGLVSIQPHTTLNLTNEPGGITDVLAGSVWGVYGNFAVAGVANTGFANLTSVEGEVDFGNNQTTNITPNGGTLNVSNSGHIDVSYSNTAVLINGDVNNSGTVSMNFYDCCGGATLSITGTLTNNAGAELTVNGPILSNLLNVGMVVNSGTVGATNSTINVFGDLSNNVGGVVDLEGGSTLAVTGNATNSGTLTTTFQNLGGNNNLNIGGSLDNFGVFVLAGPGDVASVGNGLTNESGGHIGVLEGSTLAVTGDLLNLGFIETIDAVGNQITISGNLDNYNTIHIVGPNDLLSVGANLTNESGAFIDVEGGSTLTVAGDVSNSGGLITNFAGTGGGNTITINGMLTNEAAGQLTLYGPGDVASIGNGVLNSGMIDVDGGSTLAITGDVNNSGTIQTDPGGNTITISGTLNNSGLFELLGPADMASIGGDLNNSIFGTVEVDNGSTLNVAGTFDNRGFLQSYAASGNTVNLAGGAGTMTNEAGGAIDVEFGAALAINGNVINTSAGVDRGIITGSLGTGGNTFTITGNLDNTSNGNLQLLGAGDMASIGNGLMNAGTADVENGSTLNIIGDVSNAGTIETNLGGVGGNNTITISGMLNNTGTFLLNGPGDMASIGNGVFNDTNGLVDVEGASTLNITGDVTNNGMMGTSFQSMGGSGGNLLNITGSLANNGEFGWAGLGGGGTITGDVFNTNFFVVFGGATGNIGGTFTNSDIAVLEEFATLNVAGDVINTGVLGESAFTNVGGNALNVTGTLFNSGQFFMGGPADSATLGNLFNAAGASVDVEGGSTLTVKGDADNAGTFLTNMNGNGGMNTVTINGTLTNELGAFFTLNGPGDAANIGTANNSGKFTVAGGSTATMGSLNNPGDVEIGGGSTLQVNGDVNNSGIIETANDVLGGGNTVNITGNLTNQGMEGFGLFGSGDKATIGGNLINSAIVTVENGSTLQIKGAVDNSGAFGTNLFGTGGGNSITVHGLLTNEASGFISLNGPGDVLKALAGLSNSGVINVNNGSSIDPPFVNNLGTITIDGKSRLVVGTPTPMGGQGYIQLANGTLGEMISATNFGVINVEGSALLDGTLAILLQGGFNPAIGSTYKFLNFTPGELNGVFASIENDIFNGGTEKWVLDYDNADGYLELTAEQNQAVPEPATLLVLIPGLLGMGYGLRRRWSL